MSASSCPSVCNMKKPVLPPTASWSFWCRRGGSKRACGPMMSWMWSSSTLQVTWTCCLALRTCSPGKCTLTVQPFCNLTTHCEPKCHDGYQNTWNDIQIFFSVELLVQIECSRRYSVYVGNAVLRVPLDTHMLSCLFHTCAVFRLQLYISNCSIWNDDSLLWLWMCHKIHFRCDTAVSVWPPAN